MTGKWDSGLVVPQRDRSKPYRHVVRDLNGRTYPADLTHYFRKWDMAGGRTIGLNETGPSVDYPARRVVIVAALIVAALVILFAVV